MERVSDMNHFSSGDVELSEQVDVVVAQTVVKLPNTKWIKAWPGLGAGSLYSNDGTLKLSSNSVQRLH